MENIGFHEDLLREFKSDRSCLSDGEIIDAVVAVANTDGGDLILVSKMMAKLRGFMRGIMM